MLLFHTHTKLKMVDDEPLPLTSYVHFANGIAKVDRYGRRTPPMHKTKKNSKPLLCILCSLARLHSTYIQFDCYKNSCFMHLHASAMYLIVHEFSIAPFKKKQNAQRHTQKVKKNHQHKTKMHMRSRNPRSFLLQLSDGGPIFGFIVLAFSQFLLTSKFTHFTLINYLTFLLICRS